MFVQPFILSLRISAKNSPESSKSNLVMYIYIYSNNCTVCLFLFREGGRRVVEDVKFDRV